MSRIFRARYPGRCSACGEPIEVDVEALYAETGTHTDVVVHADCDDVLERRQRVAPVCDRCHLTKPCECDDEEPS